MSFVLYDNTPEGHMRVVCFFLLAALAAAQKHVSFATADGGLVYADVYGTGSRGVVLAHGEQFNKESWAPQARVLAAAGFRVLAFDFRSYGKSHGPGQADIYTAPLQRDVLAAVRYLRRTGTTSVSVVGASLGGDAAAQAFAEARPNEIDRLVLMADVPDTPPAKLTGPKLYIVARDDNNGAGPRLLRIRAHYERAPEPKELLVVEGSAHAQFLFQTGQGERVMREILRFLSTH
jgi:pimeloyl-ACP methyl ester carboxylesterase